MGTPIRRPSSALDRDWCFLSCTSVQGQPLQSSPRQTSTHRQHDDASLTSAMELTHAAPLYLHPNASFRRNSLHALLARPISKLDNPDHLLWTRGLPLQSRSRGVRRPHHGNVRLLRPATRRKPKAPSPIDGRDHLPSTNELLFIPTRLCGLLRRSRTRLLSLGGRDRSGWQRHASRRRTDNDRHRSRDPACPHRPLHHCAVEMEGAAGHSEQCLWVEERQYCVGSWCR